MADGGEARATVLEVDGLTKAFAGLRAVDGYGLRLRQGEILGIIGPNGAGKSTVFNLLTGHIAPTSGTIRFRGVDITGRAPEKIARMGMGRTFQNIRLFPTMTVLGNVACARQLRRPRNLAATLLSLPSFLRDEEKLRSEALEELAILGLADKAGSPAGALPYGDQRRLEIARALALEPALLLLDEPTAGMNAAESARILDFIRDVHGRHGLTIIVVEHNMPLIMRLCSRIQVLNYGQVIAEGTPEQVRADPRVIESYLGQAQADAPA